MGRGEGGRAEGDGGGRREDDERTREVAVGCWWQSKKPQPCHNCQFVAGERCWHLHSFTFARALPRRIAETSLIHVLTVVKGTLHPSLFAGETKQKGKVTEKDPKEQQIQIFSFSADKSLCFAVSFHSPGFLHHYLNSWVKKWTGELGWCK